jgi:uncharacterized protein (DUF2252 family)
MATALAAPPPAPDSRLPLLHQLRRLKMARSAHAYVRGSTEAFYEWLDSPAGTDLPPGPAVWICGDCHVGNLGPIGRTVGSAVIEIRDLDQTVIGNPAYDLTRLGLSLAMAARGSSLPGVTVARMTEALVAGYEAAFAGAIPSEAANDLPSPLRFVMKNALRRTHNTLIDERLGDKRRRFKIGRRFWPLTAAERAAAIELTASEPIRQLVTRLESRDPESQVSLLDAAYWVKGCSSLGLWRGALLIEVRPRARKKSDSRSLCLLDVKEAVDPLAPARKASGLADHPASRVLAGAKKIAPALGARMAATHLLDRSVFVRELLPQDLKVELDELSVEDGRGVAYYLGSVVGRAHARQLDSAQCRAWQAEMNARRSKTIDAPSWLWTAVVDLVGVHERAYLEHCRRYALDHDKRETPD